MTAWPRRERLSPRLDFVELIMPSAHLGKFAQRQGGLFRVGKCHPHGEVRYCQSISDEPRVALEVAVQHGGKSTESVEALINGDRISIALTKAESAPPCLPKCCAFQLNQRTISI